MKCKSCGYEQQLDLYDDNPSCNKCGIYLKSDLNKFVGGYNGVTRDLVKLGNIKKSEPSKLEVIIMNICGKDRRVWAYKSTNLKGEDFFQVSIIEDDRYDEDNYFDIINYYWDIGYERNKTNIYFPTNAYIMVRNKEEYDKVMQVCKECKYNDNNYCYKLRTKKLIERIDKCNLL